MSRIPPAQVPMADRLLMVIRQPDLIILCAAYSAGVTSGSAKAMSRKHLVDSIRKTMKSLPIPALVNLTDDMLKIIARDMRKTITIDKSTD